MPEGTLTTSVANTFDSVLTIGTTTVTAAESPTGGATEAPAGFWMDDPPIYYDVSTTAAVSGPIVPCFTWQEGQFENENGIGLFRFEADSWVDTTTSLDISESRVCGQVGSLSPCALFEAPYFFSGSFPPVDNTPVRNTVKAGAAPVKFSLSGNLGLDIFSSGYPPSQALVCDGGAPTDAIMETEAAGSSSLTYDLSLGNASTSGRQPSPGASHVGGCCCDGRMDLCMPLTSSLKGRGRW